MDIKSKKLMILGASYSQVPLIKAAKRLGLKTVVATLPGVKPGIKEADEVFYGDLRNVDEILNGAKSHQIDGIATCCMDTGIRALGYVCEKLNLYGISEEAGIIASNKARMKEMLIRNKVNTARYEVVSTKEDMLTSIEELSLPLVVKAVDLQGSLGIYIVSSINEALDAFNKVMLLTKERFCILEQYINGYEVGAEAFIYNGEILFVLPHRKDTYFSTTAVPIGHSMPFIEDNYIIDQIVNQITKAIKSVGYDNCAINVDMIIQDGEVYIIELTGRIGATGLPELVNTYYGIDIYEMIVLAALGENPKIALDKRNEIPTPCLAQLLISEKDGIVKSIQVDKIDNPNIIDLSLNVNIGSQIRKFTNGNDRIGQVIIKGNNLDECYELLEEVKGSINIEVDVK